MYAYYTVPIWQISLQPRQKTQQLYTTTASVHTQIAIQNVIPQKKKA